MPQLLDSHENESSSSLRAKSRVLAHAYNNQHQIAEGYLMCLQNNRSSDEEMKKDIACAIEAIRNANRLTQCLSENARSEEVVMTAAGLIALLRGLAERLSIKHVTSIEAEADAHAFMVRGDSGLVYQAIVSLVENSCEACFDSQKVSINTELIKITKTIEEDSCYLEAGSYLKVEIVDNGRGMTQQLLSESHKLMCSTKSNEHGVGLGIPLARDVAERYGGALVIQSEEGLGTKATIFIALE